MSFLSSLKNAVNSIKKVFSNSTNEVVNAVNSSASTFVFDKLPSTLEELKARPEANLKDKHGVIALVIVALNVYGNDKQAGIDMLNFLKGPSPLSNYEIQFIDDCFTDKKYVPRSFFNGATPENSYEPSKPYTIVVRETPHSNDAIKEGYYTGYVTSGGADTPRPVMVRQKASTKQWFLNSYPGLLSGVRLPANQDPWA